MKVLITGATGFLGTHCVAKFLEKGATVVGMDKDDFYFNTHLAKEIEVHKYDVREIRSHGRDYRGFDAVVHCAGALHDSPPEVIYSVNLGGTQAALDMCLENGIPRFLYCSSTVVYGYFEHRPPVTEESPLAPQHPYAISKVKCEAITRSYRDRGLNTLVVRPKSFTGAGRFGVFQLLCDWIHHGSRIPVFGNSRNRFQLLGVTDLAQGMYDMTALPIKNETLNLGADSFRTVDEDLTDLLAYANTGSRLMHVPSAPVKAALSVIEKLKLTQLWSWHYKTADRDSYVDIGRAQKLIHWKPKQSNVDILKETYDWYCAHMKEFEGKTGLGHHGVVWRERLLSLVRDLL